MRTLRRDRGRLCHRGLAGDPCPAHTSTGFRDDCPSRRAGRSATACRLSLQIDGRLSEAAWKAAPWSDPFVDIDGTRRPPLGTRMKMLWDDDHFYIGAELEEPDLWGTLETRDSVIFQDNDFEVFIDPDGDTHCVLRARDQRAEHGLGPAAGSAVPRRRARHPCLGHRRPAHGRRSARHDQSSRRSDRGLVDRDGDPVDDPGRSRATAQPAACRGSVARQLLACAVAVGRAERGLCEAARCQDRQALPRRQLGLESAGRNQHAHARAVGLRAVLECRGCAIGRRSSSRTGTNASSGRCGGCYYRQRDYRSTHGRYASDLSLLNVADIRVDGMEFRPSIQVTDSLYELRAAGFDDAVVHLRQDGRVWVTR